MEAFDLFNCFQLLHNMNDKTIKERIAKLEAQRAQMISNVHAIEGAIQDCKFWLEEVSRTKNNDNVVKIAKEKK